MLCLHLVISPQQSARHIDAGSMVWTLIDNGKLADQIARLAAILVKKKQH